MTSFGSSGSPSLTFLREAWEGLASMEDLRLIVQERLDYGDPSFTWRLIHA